MEAHALVGIVGFEIEQQNTGHAKQEVAHAPGSVVMQGGGRGWLRFSTRAPRPSRAFKRFTATGTNRHTGNRFRGGRDHPSASRLLLGQRTNDGQYQLLILIRLDKQHQPQYKKADSDEPENRQQHQRPATRKNSHKSKHKPESDGEDRVENRLKRMKTDLGILIVGREDKKENASDEPQRVAEGAGHVIG